MIKHKNNIDIEIPQNIVNKKQLPSSDNLTTNNNNSPLIKEDISLRSSNENSNFIYLLIYVLKRFFTLFMF